MALTDVNQATVGLGLLQLRENSNKTSATTKQAAVFGRSTKYSTMSITSSFLGKQDNQNAAALSPEMGINRLLERTKYPIIQENGQRCYGPPPNWKNEAPQRGCEVFIGKIPRDCYEDELIPIFERIGPIYMFRLMMEITGSNRGYGFCVYTSREDTKRAVQELDNYEIRKGKVIGVCISVDNCRLFVGGIPKIKTKEEIMQEMKRVTEGVKDVIAYPSLNDKSKNRGFAFVEYESHKAAAMARRKLYPGRIQLWGQQIAVDWAEPEKEVNEDIMQKVKILYVRNLMLSTTEESLREHFVHILGGDQNCIERVKKISDYAFVHFKEREQANKCLEALNDTNIEGSRIEVTWAKPADKTDANSRQQANRASSRLTGEFLINKDLNSNTITATSGLISSMDTAAQFILPGVGQHQPLAPELLSINPNTVNPATGGIGFGNPGTRLNGPRVGRRNAAGSRSAGAQRDRKHPVEILEEISRFSGWGTPLYSVGMLEMFTSYNPYKLPLYVGQVCLPNLNLQYTSVRGYPTQEEAKAGACEVALHNLCYNQLMLETTLPKSQNPVLLAGSNGVSLSPATSAIAAQGSPKTGASISECGHSGLTETHRESNPLQLVPNDPNPLIYNPTLPGATQNMECLQSIQCQGISQPIRLDNNVCSDNADVAQLGSSCRSCTMYRSQPGSLVPMSQVNLPPFTQFIFPTAQPPLTSSQTIHPLTVSSTDHQQHQHQHHQQQPQQYNHHQQQQTVTQSVSMPCFTSVHNQPSYSNLPNQVVQYLASPYPAYRPIQNTQLGSNQSVGIPTCQGITATMNNHMMSPGTSYLPYTLQSVSNSMGLLPPVANLSQLGSNPVSMASQGTNQMPPINLASNLQPMTDCAAITGFDYYPGSLSAFANTSAYFFDPLLLGSNPNLSGFPSGMLEGKSGITNASNGGSMLDLAPNPLPLPSTVSSVVGSASQLTHPGLYTLSLPVPAVATQMVQPSNQCGQQPASLVGLYAHHPQQVTSNNKPIASVSVSLANTQSVSNKKSSQLSLPVPAHV